MLRSKVGARIGVMAAWLAVGFCSPAWAEKRVALLIGNNAYENVRPLKTAISDARTLGSVLKTMGFEVLLVEDQSRRAMSEALLAFDKAIEPGDTALFFFAGHGFEVHGQNYLIPTDVPAAAEGQEELVRDSSFAAERIVERLQLRGARTAILVLDACRNNPFEVSGTRALSGRGGLVSMTPPEGVFIMFSAGAKQTALDALSTSDPNPNSVFTRVLAGELPSPGLTLVQMAKRVQLKVKELAASVRHEQTPAYYDQVIGDVVLNDSGGGTSPAQKAAAASGPGAMEELDALAAAGNWRELGAHLTDVKPSARDDHWRQLVEQAATGELEPLATHGGGAPAERLAAIERYYPAFPSLGDSSRFLALRTKIGIEALGRCFDDARDFKRCLDDLEGFIHVEPVTSGLALEAAHVVGVKLNRAAAVSFFLVSVEAPGGQSVCTDAMLAEAAVAALGLPPDYERAKIARQLIERCWEAVKIAVTAEVARESPTGYYLVNACPSLISHNAVTGLRQTRCRQIVAQ